MSSDNIFLYVGGDLFQKEKQIQRATKHFFGQDEELELSRFSISNTPVKHIVEEFLSFSLFTPNKMIVVDEVDKIKAKKKEDKEILQNFVHHLQRPQGEIPVLLFADSQKEIPKDIIKAIPSSNTQKLEKTSPKQIREYVQKKSTSQSVEFAPKALNLFMEHCGHDASVAVRELDKILLWASEGSKITEEDCQRLLQVENEKDIWSITRAVAGKDTQAAYDALFRLTYLGETPVSIVRILSQTFLTMLHCKTLVTEKIPKNEWSSRTGLYGFRLDINMRQCQAFSINDLRTSITLLRQADDDLKGSKSNDIMLLERLVYELCSSRT